MSSKITEAEVLTLANILTSLRLVIGPVMLYFAWIGDSTFFIGFYVLSLLLGFTDGLISRRLNQVTELGGKLDSWGDLTTVITVPICAWWLWPELVRQETPFVIAALVGYIVPVILGFLKYGRLTSYHTWTTKLSLVLTGIGVLVAFVGGPLWFDGLRGGAAHAGNRSARRAGGTAGPRVRDRGEGGAPVPGTGAGDRGTAGVRIGAFLRVAVVRHHRAGPSGSRSGGDCARGRGAGGRPRASKTGGRRRSSGCAAVRVSHRPSGLEKRGWGRAGVY